MLLESLFVLWFAPLVLISLGMGAYLTFTRTWSRHAQARDTAALSIPLPEAPITFVLAVIVYPLWVLDFLYVWRAELIKDDVRGSDGR